jgi:hypothetical protein
MRPISLTEVLLALILLIEVLRWYGVHAPH